MGANTKIQWCHHTFNCWRGCTKISAGCAACYAEIMSHRNPAVLGVWGPNGTRVLASEAKWREPLAWDKKAREIGERHRVFCASLADVFEDWNGPIVNSFGEKLWLAAEQWTMRGEKRPNKHCRPLALDDVRSRLRWLIFNTPNLDWLVLTKRPENAARWIADHLMPPNVWLGVSVENQETADARIPVLLRTPASIRFLSMEPLLGPVDLTRLDNGGGEMFDALRATVTTHRGHSFIASDVRPIDWIIIGGESGSKARRCELEWIRSIVRQCQEAGVKAFVKQLGSRATDPVNGIAGKRLKVHPDAAGLISVRLKDDHGGDWMEWPEDLRVRQMPVALARKDDALQC